MNQTHTFVIRRGLVAPLGLLIALMLALLIVSVLQGQPIAKIVILTFFLLPVIALFVECVARRLVIDQDGVKAFRPFRQRQVLFADVTGLETVRVRSRVFMTLVAGDDDFLIISNSYGDFPSLVAALIAAVPEGTVAEETQELAKQPSFRQGDIFTVWFAVLALVYVLIAQFKA